VFSAISNPSAFRWMYVVDLIMLSAAMMLISLVRWGRAWPDYSLSDYLLGFVIVTIVHVVVAYFGGLCETDSCLGATSRLPRIASLIGIAILIDASLSLGSSKFLVPRLNLVVFSVLATSMLAFNRWLAHRVLTASFGRPRVLLVGNPDDIELAEAHLVETDRDAIIVGRRSSTEDLALAVKQVSTSDVLLLAGIELSEVYPKPPEDFESQRVGIYHRLTPSDPLLGVKKAIQIAGMAFVALRSHAMAPSKARLKRILDLSVSLRLRHSSWWCSGLRCSMPGLSVGARFCTARNGLVGMARPSRWSRPARCTRVPKMQLVRYWRHAMTHGSSLRWHGCARCASTSCHRPGMRSEVIWPLLTEARMPRTRRTFRDGDAGLRPPPRHLTGHHRPGSGQRRLSHRPWVQARSRPAIPG
jgi:hypothetical protein